MSYRCQVCAAKVPHNQPLLRHVVYKPSPPVKPPREGESERPAPKPQIAREIPVCAVCKDYLERGGTLTELWHLRRGGPTRRVKPSPTAAPAAAIDTIVAQPPVFRFQTPPTLERSRVKTSGNGTSESKQKRGNDAETE